MSEALALLLVAVALHVLTAVFWTGASFVLARFGPEFGGVRLRRMLLWTATLSIAIGLGLWLERRGEWGRDQADAMVLGAVAAFAAVGLQSALGLPAARQIGGPNTAAAGVRLRMVDRTVAALLAIAVCAMVLARYV